MSDFVSTRQFYYGRRTETYPPLTQVDRPRIFLQWGLQVEPEIEHDRVCGVRDL